MNTLSPTSPIPQPPHSAGLSFKGLRAAIDPQSIPSPLETIENDREQWEDQSFGTLSGGHVPLSTTDYVAIDQGNSSPKYIRASTWHVPSTSRLASDCGIPLAAVIQPFAEQDPSEEPVPLVETGDIGPARCAQCRGYVNPWCKWMAGGMRWKCNLCSHETDVVPEYFCNLDVNMNRLDHLQRPELNKGTVDFAVPRDYWAPNPPPPLTPLYQPVVSPPASEFRQPKPLSYIFALDVSLEAIQSGFTRAACASLLELLFGSEAETEGGISVEPCVPTESSVAIITYDQTIHFYDLSPRASDVAAMLVVSDLEDIFVPIREGLFVDPRESRQVITNLLATLGQSEGKVLYAHAALGSALTACLAALAGTGGHVVVFSGVIPAIGLGALKTPPDENALFGTDKEKTLFAPRDNAWRDLGEQCANEGIGVSMFLGMSRPIDVASVGVVSSLSGGELYFHPRFDTARDGPVMHSQLRRLFLRKTVHSCAMRVRCSSGLRITQHYGNFYESAIGDLMLGTLDSDKTISVALEHTGSLSETSFAFIQSAVLYTSVSGQRRVRVCNVGLNVATMAGNVFRYADMDTVVSYMLRQGVSKLPQEKIAKVQDELTSRCMAILLGYRKMCAVSASPSQLIIPEAFRALPLYTLAMLKTKSLKGRNITADVRNLRAHKVRAMSVRTIMQHLYPRLLALHDLDGRIALPDPTTGRIKLPSLMRASYIFMESYGIYLIDNEEMMVLWIGSDVSPQILKDLLGVDDFWQIDPHITQLPILETRLSIQVRNILNKRYAPRGWVPKFQLARRNMDAAEIEFSDMLVEDQNSAAMSYLDYLCHVHRLINQALTGTGSPANGSGFKTPW